MENEKNETGFTGFSMFRRSGKPKQGMEMFSMSFTGKGLTGKPMGNSMMTGGFSNIRNMFAKKQPANIVILEPEKKEEVEVLEGETDEHKMPD